MALPTVYFGTLTGFPEPPYSVQFAVGETLMIQESDPINSGFTRMSTPDLSVSGTYDYANATYLFEFVGTVQSGTEVFAYFQPTSTEIVRPDPDPDCLLPGYQARPEDEISNISMDMPDEYPWRRPIVGGGELVDFDSYSPSEPDIKTVPLGQTVSVCSQTGAQYDVQVIVPGPFPPRFVTSVRGLDNYVPGQQAIAFTGTFLDLAGPRPSSGTLAGGLDGVMEPGWQLFHFGLVQGVLVADPVKFFGKHHRDGLALWYPFNEHPLDAIEIADHSPYAGNPFIAVRSDAERLNGIEPGDRAFDPVRGNYLSAEPGLILKSPVSRGFNRAVSGGFWIRPTGDIINDYSEIDLFVGPFGVFFINGVFGDPLIVFALSNADNDGSYTFLQQEVMDADWAYVSWSYDGDRTITSAVWKSSGLSVQTVTAGFAIQSYPLTLEMYSFGAFPFDIQDLRLWNITKTVDELDLAHNHDPNPTACLYRPAWLQSANTYDHYAVRVLPSGFVVPDQLPTSIIDNQLAWVERYDYLARYDAQSRYKETGIGSGNTPPDLQRLGAQWDTLTMDGTMAVSTWQGNFVGINEVWKLDNPAGTVLTLIESGSTVMGIAGTLLTTGTRSPWPNPLQATNPCRDRIWVRGDDGFVWQIMLSNTEGGDVAFETERIFSSNGSYQPTGAHVELSNGTISKQLHVSTSGSVYSGTYSGTVTSAPIYMYSNEETVVDLSGTNTTDAWVQPNVFGLDQTPPVAALKTNGQIGFEISDEMLPGFYRLTVTSGNVGKVDTSFVGFNVVVTVGDVFFQAKLCAGESGANFNHTDTFDFYLPHTLPGSPSSWLLLFDWSNALKDVEKGTARQLFISAVNLTRFNTRLYELSVQPGSIQMTPFATASADFPDTPGGWLAKMSSWGTAYGYAHESTVYSSNDTVVNPQPLSNKLGATTMYRTEDIVLNGSFTLADQSIPAFVTFGTLDNPCPATPGCPTPTSFPTADLASDTYGLFTMAYHAPTETLWVPDDNSSDVYIISTVTQTIVHVLDMSPAWGATDAWQVLWDSVNDQMVIAEDGDSVAFVDPYDYSILDALTGLIGGNGAFYNQMAYDSTRGNILFQDTVSTWVGGESKQVLISGATHAVLQTNTFVGQRIGNPVYCSATDKFYFSFTDDEELQQADPVSLAVTGSGLSFPNAGEYGLFFQWVSQLNRIFIGVSDGGDNVVRVSSLNPGSMTLVGDLSGPDVPGVIWGIQDIEYNSCANTLYVCDLENVFRFDTSTLVEIDITPAELSDSLVFVPSTNLMWVLMALDDTFDHGHLFTM